MWIELAPGSFVNQLFPTTSESHPNGTTLRDMLRSLFKM
jgi:hypothetical protein